MTQQRLLFTLPITPGYHTWVHHQGTTIACIRLSVWLNKGGTLWLKSESPAGKSHLLRALEEEYPQLARVQIQPSLSALQQVASWLEILENYDFWSIDLPAHDLPKHTATALFHLIERAKEKSCPLLIAWRCADDELILPELASRMRMLEQVYITPPESDHDLHSVLKAAAQQLHWDIPDKLIKVMLTHLPRDLDNQLSAVKHLEAASQTERTRMTQTWARQKLNI
jgi:chromosomal replication initiation ATPase DnaA